MLPMRWPFRSGRPLRRIRPAAKLFRRWFRPVVEQLEDRLVPATITVTTVADATAVDGSVSLREAIQSINQGADANADVNAAGAYGANDTIQFAIPGTGPQTIHVGATGLGALPTITKAVLLDGYSQPGASANTLAVGDNAVLTVELDGTAAGAGANGPTLTGGGSTVRGLAINRFGGAGVELGGAGSVLAGNFIGTDPGGATALGNGSVGV